MEDRIFAKVTEVPIASSFTTYARSLLLAQLHVSLEP